MKSEPNVFGFDDLERLRPGTEPWEGVRNYQARNMLRDQMRPGDLAFFHHSGCEQPGIAGIISIASRGYPDASALDRKSPYFDAESARANPRWYCVDVKFKRRLNRLLKNSFQQPVNAVQDAPPFFKPLKNEEKQKSHFLLFELKKSMDGLFQHPVKRYLGLDELRAQKILSGLALLQRGNRLSVMPVSVRHWNVILDLERRQKQR